MAKFSKKSDFFFDLDHTLWDFEKNSALTFRELFKKYCIEVELSKFLEKYVPNNEFYWKLFRNGKIDKQTLRYKRL